MNQQRNRSCRMGLGRHTISTIILANLPDRTMIHTYTHIPQHEVMGWAFSIDSRQPLNFTPAANLSMILFDC
jgi:hypothetical protein